MLITCPTGVKLPWSYLCARLWDELITLACAMLGMEPGNRWADPPGTPPLHVSRDGALLGGSEEEAVFKADPACAVHVSKLIWRPSSPRQDAAHLTEVASLLFQGRCWSHFA